MEAFLENIYFGPWDACIFEVAPALALSALLVMLWSWREGGREGGRCHLQLLTGHGRKKAVIIHNGPQLKPLFEFSALVENAKPYLQLFLFPYCFRLG